MHEGRDWGIFRWITVLGALTVLVKIFAFVEKQAIAYKFGAGGEVDAYWVAQSLPLMAYSLTAALVTPTILPMFVRKVARGEEREGWNQCLSWLLVLGAVFFVFTLVCGLYPERIGSILAPGFEWADLQLLKKMIWVFLPSIFLLGILPLLQTVLNSRENFHVPPIADTIIRILTVASIFFLSHRFGVLAIPIGYTVGVLLGFGFAVLFLLKPFMSFRAQPHFSDPEFRFVLFLMAAPFVGKMFSHVATIVENAVSSNIGEGYVSALNFAKKVIDLPLVVVPLAVSTVLYTYMTKARHEENPSKAADLLYRSIRSMLLLFIPLSILTAVFAEAIVRLVFERGSFDHQSTQLVSVALLWLSPTLICYSVEMLLMKHFFSREDLWPPTIIGILGVILRILLILLLYREWELAGIGLAIVSSRVFKIGLLFAFCCLRSEITLKGILPIEILKIVVASMILCFTTLMFRLRFEGSFSSDLMGTLFFLSVGTTLGVVSFFLASWFLKSRDLMGLLRLVKVRFA